MSKSNVLVTAPNYDRMTRYLSVMSAQYVAEMTAHGHQVHHLKDHKVTKATFEGYIKKQKPEVILINGHGADDRIAGHDHEIILDTNSVDILKGVTIYALACKSAQLLGHAAIKAGATGYVGYSQDFILVSQPNKVSHPEDDTTADLFLEPSKVISTALAKGYTAKEAARKGHDAYTNSIKKALNSDIQSDDDKYIPYLVWNRTFLKSC